MALIPMYVCIIICDTYLLLSFKKMDKLVMMINQGINEVIADDFARDRGQRLPQCKIQAHTSITFVTIKTPQLGCNRLSTDGYRLTKLCILFVNLIRNETNWQIKANLFQLI